MYNDYFPPGLVKRDIPEWCEHYESVMRCFAFLIFHKHFLVNKDVH